MPLDSVPVVEHRSTKTISVFIMILPRNNEERPKSYCKCMVIKCKDSSVDTHYSVFVCARSWVCNLFTTK